MYFIFNVETTIGTECHVMMCPPDGGIVTFPTTADTANNTAFNEWVAEGNEPEEWTGE